MEEILKNKDIAYILYLVSEKYPNYKSEKKEINKKLIIFKEKISKDFFRKFCYNYINNNHLTIQPEDLADDILNISVILSDKMIVKNPEIITNLKEENLALYLLLIRNVINDEIFTLNKLILDNQTLEKIKESKKYFDTEEEYLNYINLMLSQKFFRFWVLEKNNINYTESIEKLRKEIYMELDGLKFPQPKKYTHKIRQYKNYNI